MISIAIAIVIAIVAMLLMVSRFSRLSIVWGGLWGSAMGACAVAPVVLHVHHLYPRTLGEWLTISAALLVIFSAIGSALMFIVCAPVAIAQTLLRTRVRRIDLVCASLTALLLPAVYLSFSALIEWRNFSRAPSPMTYAMMTTPLGLLWFVAGVLCAIQRARHPATELRTERWLRSSAVACALLGFLVLPWRIPANPSLQKTVDVRPTRLSGVSKPAPLLVVAFDGGNWTTMQPLIDQGRLPVLSSLIENGMRGHMQAQWPPYWSAPAWGAIWTGHTADEIGVHEDLAATAPGLPPFELSLTLNPVIDPILAIDFLLAHLQVIHPEPPPSDALHERPVWELMTDAGVKTAVVRMYFTYPVTDRATVMVSQRIVTDLWAAVGTADADKSMVVFPPAETGLIFNGLTAAEASADAEFQKLVPSASEHRPPPATNNSIKILRALLGFDDIANAVFGMVDDPVVHLRKVFDFDHRTLRVTEQILREHPDLDVVMVYVGGFDLACHAFWQYRFPQSFPVNPPSATAVADLGPVIDRYLEYVDQSIGRIAAGFRTPPNIIVLSDHGEQAEPNAPLWKGVHAPLGVFLAAGPNIRHSPDKLNVSYFDIVPTLLDIEGLSVPPGINGRSVR